MVEDDLGPPKAQYIGGKKPAGFRFAKSGGVELELLQQVALNLSPLSKILNG